MATKTKVWVGDMSKSRFTVAHVVYGEVQPMKSRAAVLVDFGGDHHERVFTESEVRAILMDLKEENIAISGLRTIAKRHGIILDPA